MAWTKNSRYAKFSTVISGLPSLLWAAEKLIGLAGLPDDADNWLKVLKSITSMIPDPLGWMSLGATCVFLLWWASAEDVPERLGRKLGWIRTADKETLLRNLNQLSAAYQEFESDKRSPRSTGTAARIWNLSQKHADLLAPVADGEAALAVEFCIGILETEDDFTKAVEIIKERLEKPFIRRIRATLTAGSPTMSARATVVKVPFYRRILYKIRRLLGLSPIPPKER